MPQSIITQVNELAADQPSLLTPQPEISHEIPVVDAAAVETISTEYDSNDKLTTPAKPALIKPMDAQEMITILLHLSGQQQRQPSTMTQQHQYQHRSLLLQLEHACRQE
jgi:hypothetical protein